jgi:hypothetical protein
MSTLAPPFADHSAERARATAEFHAEAHRQVYTFVRYWTALVILVYGFAKVFGTQFYTLLSDLDTPLGQVGGFKLLWHYFDYSPGYMLFVAAGELLGGVCLLFRRTTLLGALMLLAILANVAAADVFYDVGGVLPVTLMLLGCVGFLLYPYRGVLTRLLLDSTVVYPRGSPRARASLLGRWPARALAMLVPALFIGVWVRGNVREPTPIDGKWAVGSRSHAGSAASLLDSAAVIYFEPRFAGKGVFVAGDRRREARFEVDERSRSLKIHETYWGSSPLVFTGTYALAGDTLRISGRAKGDAVSLVLARAPVAGER